MKNYFYIIFFIFGLGFGATSYAQKPPSKISSSDFVNDLSIYPNPVSNGKIYITTKENLTKDVEIYDVLGKKILSRSVFGKELNISELPGGIYILKIREGKNSATRKLVVR